jgi:hypothetical protein
VLDIPGVASLVPNVTTALKRLRIHQIVRTKQSRTRNDSNTADRKSGREGDPDTSGDGITVTIEDDDVTVILDVIVTSTTSVLDTAIAIRSAAENRLEATHPARCTVKVNVLAIEPTPPSQTAPRGNPGRRKAGSAPGQ